MTSTSAAVAPAQVRTDERLTSYRGPDGKQYIAVLAGVGGWAGGIVSGDLDAHDATAGGGFVNAMRDLPQHTTKGGMLYVFTLP